MLWRAGLRISEALALNENDLDVNRGAVLIRHGKGDKRREVGIDRWAWSHLDLWLQLRGALPAGRLFCVVRPWHERFEASMHLHHRSTTGAAARTEDRA